LKTFDFLVDRLPFGYAFNFDNYLFNKLRHINTRGVEDRADYFLINNVKKRIEGKIHFSLKDNIAYSPYKSLFGSFEFSPRLHPRLLTEFWAFIEQDLRSRKIESVRITSYAECYAPRKVQIVKDALEQAGFLITLRAVNHHIAINENDLENRMHPMEVKRLSKCRAAGFVFKEEASGQAGEIYDYLHQCRFEQGLHLSISKEQWQEYLTVFPQNYPFFTVRHGEEIMAATIAIRVHRHILYSFLPGSLRKYKHFSPTVMLNEGVYNYCRNLGIEILDLGISTEKNGKNQKSLIAFKERNGGEMSYKYFFEKQL
jgi:hypothetical protein